MTTNSSHELTGEEQYFGKLSKQQQEFVAVLKKIGFEWKYFSTYKARGWGEVHISKISSWAELLTYAYRQGQEAKQFEIRSALGL